MTAEKTAFMHRPGWKGGSSSFHPRFFSGVVPVLPAYMAIRRAGAGDGILAPAFLPRYGGGYGHDSGPALARAGALQSALPSGGDHYWCVCGPVPDCLLQSGAWGFLGGVALWLSLCTIVGTLERDFRAYAAMLSGYTVAIVGISCIDNPAAIFDVTVNRVSCIVVGIASTAAINDIFGSPTAFEKLTANLRRTSDMVRRIAKDALAGHSIPDSMACAGLAGEIIALTSQISFAKTELPDARLRLAGARSAMVALLEMLSCSQAIALVLRKGEVSDAVLKHIRDAFGDGTPVNSPAQAVHDLEDLAREAHENELCLGPTLDEAWLIERSMAVLSDTRWAVDGIDAFEHGQRARTQAPELKIEQHDDVIAALLNGLRTLIGFSIAAGLCIISDIPATYSALSQVAIILTLAATTYNVRGFGMGALLGTPLAIIVAAVLNFGILPKGRTCLFWPWPLFLSFLAAVCCSYTPRRQPSALMPGCSSLSSLAWQTSRITSHRPLLTATCCTCSPRS